MWLAKAVSDSEGPKINDGRGLVYFLRHDSKLSQKKADTVPVNTLKVYTPSTPVTALILNLGTRWNGQPQAPAASLPRKNPGTPEPIWTLRRKYNSPHSGNRTTIPRQQSQLLSYYTDWATLQ